MRNALGDLELLERWRYRLWGWLGFPCRFHGSLVDRLLWFFSGGCRVHLCVVLLTVAIGHGLALALLT